MTAALLAATSPHDSSEAGDRHILGSFSHQLSVSQVFPKLVPRQLKFYARVSVSPLFPTNSIWSVWASSSRLWRALHCGSAPQPCHPRRGGEARRGGGPGWTPRTPRQPLSHLLTQNPVSKRLLVCPPGGRAVMHLPPLPPPSLLLHTRTWNILTPSPALSPVLTAISYLDSWLSAQLRPAPRVCLPFWGTSPWLLCTLLSA